MDVREKLVELLTEITYDQKFGWYDLWDMRSGAEDIADFLIARDVTVLQWISVSEKLPKPGEDVLVVVFDGYDTYTDTDCLMRDGKWCYETENHKVTHWQPMPKPPKGE